MIAIKWYKTAKIKIVFSLILITTTVLIIAGFISYNYIKSHEINALKELANVVADRLTEYVVIPMSYGDYDQVNSFMGAEMR